MLEGPYFPADTLPNLDALDEKDLGKVRADIERLVTYCSHRIRAIQAREQGRIAAAMDEEKAMELIYDALPEWAIW